VSDSSHSIVFQQAENRLHAQKSILLALMGEGFPGFRPDLMCFSSGFDNATMSIEEPAN
jgi:hypothetical protein